MDQTYSVQKIDLIPSIPPVLMESEVKTLAHRVWGPDVEVVNYRTDAYSNEKLGFLGCHISLEVTVNNLITKMTDTRTFFVKNIPKNNAALSRTMQEMAVFDQEVAFFEHIVPLLMENYPDEPWFPSCYMVTNDTLVFEDLRIKGFTIGKKMLSREKVMSTLNAIANMHAASILAEKQLKESLINIYPKAFEIGSFFDVNGLRYKWIQAGIDVAIVVANRLGLKSGKIRGVFEHLTDGIKPSRLKCNVVSHGDLWANNIMFDDSSPPRCILVDYQMTRYCPLAHDVIFMLYLCTNREFRRKHEKEMLKYYYKALCKTLRNHQSQIQVPAWSEIMLSFEEQRIGAVMIAVLYFPTILINNKMCADLFNDPDSYMRIIFGERINTTLSIMQQDKDYRTRIEEIVTELVELAENFEQLPQPC